MPTHYQGRRRSPAGVVSSKHRAQSPPGRRPVGPLVGGGIAVGLVVAALVAQALPGSPVIVNAVAGTAVVNTPLEVATSPGSGVVGQLPASSLRMVAVSREQQRVTLPGCQGRVSGGHANGQIPVDELCAVPFAPAHRLRADAAIGLSRLNQAYSAVFGDLCISDSYRTLGSQVALAARKPRLAARPGRSEHGWGVAVDLCGKAYGTGTPEHDWLLDNAPRFGWDNPSWARAGGSKPEPWHWVYVADGRTPSALADAG